MLSFALIVVIALSVATTTNAVVCTSGTTCSSCVNIAGCGWCTTTSLCLEANSSGTGPLTGTCAGTWQHKHSQIVWRDPGSIINPLVTEIFLIAGQALDVPIEVIVPNAATQPLDLWINQDNSASMRDDIDTFSTLIPRLLTSVALIRPDYSFGYSTFVDKPIVPAGYPDGNNYEYRTEMTMSPNYNTLQITMTGILTFGNQDDPESSLTAMLLATQPGLGWRSNALKMIVTLTDADPKKEKDISTFDCWGGTLMAENNYDGVNDCKVKPCYEVGTTWAAGVAVDRCQWYGTGEDYPSLAKVKQHLLEANVFPVFAISGAAPKATFDTIVSDWGFGKTVLLASDSSNVVEAILEGIDYLTKNLFMVKTTDPNNYVQSITPTSFTSVTPQTSYKFIVNVKSTAAPVACSIIMSVLGWGQAEIRVLSTYPCYGCDHVSGSNKDIDICGFCVTPAQAGACLDCKGIPYGINIWDRCGKCGGDGMGCLDCFSTVNGTAVFDACGVCGGDNGTCYGCDNKPSGLTYDLCGVCGGTNDCLDCQQVPYGNKTIDNCSVCGGNNDCQGCDGLYTIPPKMYDQCGICGGDGNNCTDCFGILYGYGKLDQCGVCNGTNKCIGCDGEFRVPPMAYDECGVCGGDGIGCRGCDGVLGSTTENDECGVCGGNNECADCTGIPFGPNFYDSCGICLNISNPLMDICVGCDNVPYSGFEFDQCGVCNGTNACIGCDGIAFSGMAYDVCGECGGNGTACLACDGKPFSDVELDRCGVCGGRDSCVGCDDVPNSGKFYDVCGDCSSSYEEPSCVGCDRIPWSNATRDDCGVCGGTNDCFGCDSIPYSGTRYDSCGLCGGTNDCYDCNGVKWSPLVYDICNVCGGDNTTCIGCDGIAFSGNFYDKCGVCNGNNTCLGECDYIPWSDKKWDDCHVCDGGNRAFGCDGVCFSGQTYDLCGDCKATDLNSCLGCDGQPYSNLTYDECFVCGGNNECWGCDGIPNSGKEYDYCGVCGGDSLSCFHCDYWLYWDACGVCGGDNSTCSGCDYIPVYSGTPSDYDMCGVCNGTDECLGCDNVLYSGMVEDACGRCGGDATDPSTCNDLVTTTSLVVLGSVVAVTLAAVGAAVAGFFIFTHFKYGANWYIPNALLEGDSSSATASQIYEETDKFAENPNFVNPTDS